MICTITGKPFGGGGGGEAGLLGGEAFPLPPPVDRTLIDAGALISAIGERRHDHLNLFIMNRENILEQMID